MITGGRKSWWRDWVHRRQRSVKREYLERTCHVVSGLPPASTLVMSDRADNKDCLPSNCSSAGWYLSNHAATTNSPVSWFVEAVLTLSHKSYHPYNEKNKARVREDEARARAEEEKAQQRAIEAVSFSYARYYSSADIQEGEARLAALRRPAGSPSADVDPTAGLSTKEVLAKHQRERERELKLEKRERKKRDRLDFDWPSEKDRYRKRDEEREQRDRDRGSERDDRGEGSFQSGGHVNFWADLESVSS